MATYRPVYINIWKDPTFEGYKPPMKLIFIYLITNESTTESGIYPITIKTISNETGIPVKTVEELLSNGLKNVAYDFENNFIFIKNFLKYSSGGGRPDLLRKSIEKNYKNFNTPLWNEFVLIYPEYSNIIQTVGKPLANPCGDVASISNAISKDISNAINTLAPDVKTSEAPSKISFNREERKFIGITEKDIDLWMSAYPAVDLNIETAKAIAWIISAGSKGYKSNWRKFLTGWYSRCQDRGGNNGR